jgi:hypothetical protein
VQVTEAELAEYLKDMTPLFDRGPWVHVVDGREGNPVTVSPRMRAMIAEYWSRLHPRQVASVWGEAYVIEGAMQRGIITALGWIFEPPWERRFFGTLDEALAWGEGRVELGRKGHASAAVRR